MHLPSDHKFPLDLHARNVNIALQPVVWERETDLSKPRRIFVNNFSAAGGNSALLIEDAPILAEDLDSPDGRTHHLVAVSAKNGISMQGNLKSMLRFLEQNPEVALDQLSYTTTARRIHHPHRIMVNASTVQHLQKQLEAALVENKGLNRPKSAPRILYAFTGQGALYPGMGGQLFEHFPFFRIEMYRLDHM